MDLEEDFIKYCVRWALEKCKDDLEFLNQMIDKELIARLEGVLKDTFVRLTYTEGFKILKKAQEDGVKFEFPVAEWGMDLSSGARTLLGGRTLQTPGNYDRLPKSD